jgi:hypothetical protein
MRAFSLLLLTGLISCFLLITCVDPFNSTAKNTLTGVVVDGTINNLVVPQLVRLNQSIPDLATGRFGSVPLTGAQVEIRIDSTAVVALTETDPGRYQAPSEFVGQVGHYYQLRFSLKDGTTRFESDQQLMQAGPVIKSVYAQFNPTSLSPAQQLKGGYAAAHDLFVDFNDPPDQKNYYRWDWQLWERQPWCHTCVDGVYQTYRPDSTLLEDCAPYNVSYPPSHYEFDYNCRTQCWEILHSSELNLLDDRFSNGGLIRAQRVAQVPLYSKEHCLVEIRQSSLTRKAYNYFKQFADQTQNTGGLADAPPVALVGNVRNITQPGEPVIGYFTASSVSAVRYWLTRNDAAGFAPGLFQAFNGREPIPEVGVQPSRYRPPLAVCVASDSRTPIKPPGWRD